MVESAKRPHPVRASHLFSDEAAMDHERYPDFCDDPHVRRARAERMARMRRGTGAALAAGWNAFRRAFAPVHYGTRAQSRPED
jgi:hypothetical protein